MESPLVFALLSALLLRNDAEVESAPLTHTYENTVTHWIDSNCKFPPLKFFLVTHRLGGCNPRNPAWSQRLRDPCQGIFGLIHDPLFCDNFSLPVLNRTSAELCKPFGLAGSWVPLPTTDQSKFLLSMCHSPLCGGQQDEPPDLCDAWRMAFSYYFAEKLAGGRPTNNRKESWRSTSTSAAVKTNDEGGNVSLKTHHIMPGNNSGYQSLQSKLSYYNRQKYPELYKYISVTSKPDHTLQSQAQIKKTSTNETGNQQVNNYHTVGTGNQHQVNSDNSAIGTGNKGQVNSGDPIIGTGNKGQVNSGDPIIGTGNQHQVNSDNSAIGTGNKGQVNSGDPIIGTGNKGQVNSGDPIIGTGNQHQVNSDNSAIGTGNKGQVNSGDPIIGTGNKGQVNSGDPIIGTGNQHQVNSDNSAIGTGNKGQVNSGDPIIGTGNQHQVNSDNSAIGTGNKGQVNSGDPIIGTGNQHQVNNDHTIGTGNQHQVNNDHTIGTGNQHQVNNDHTIGTGNQSQSLSSEFTVVKHFEDGSANQNSNKSSAEDNNHGQFFQSPQSKVNNKSGQNLAGSNEQQVKTLSKLQFTGKVNAGEIYADGEYFHSESEEGENADKPVESNFDSSHMNDASNEVYQKNSGMAEGRPSTSDSNAFKKKHGLMDEQAPSSAHFMGYFLTAIVLCIAGYVVFHNKQKIIAFIIEGRNHKRGRRQGSGEYKKLQTSVEGVMPSLEKSSAQNYIY